MKAVLRLNKIHYTSLGKLSKHWYNNNNNNFFIICRNDAVAASDDESLSFMSLPREGKLTRVKSESALYREKFRKSLKLSSDQIVRDAVTLGISIHTTVFVVSEICKVF